jgi:hypothetical protein
MIKIVTAAVMLIVSPVAGFAAPFCLTIPGGTPMCMYYDGASCSKDANRQNGYCAPNPSEVRVKSSRVGSYCLVMPSGYSSCGYADGDTCGRDAIAQKGVCALSQGALPRQLPDPFDPNAGR